MMAKWCWKLTAFVVYLSFSVKCEYRVIFLNLFFLLAEISEYLLDMEDGSTVSFFSIVFIIRGNFQGRNLA